MSKTVSLGTEFTSWLMGNLHGLPCGLLVEPLYYHCLEILICPESLTISIFLGVPEDTKSCGERSGCGAVSWTLQALQHVTPREQSLALLMAVEQLYSTWNATNRRAVGCRCQGCSDF
jgi:hypothetical protein